MFLMAKKQSEITLHQAISEGTQLSRLKRESEENLRNAIMGAIFFVCHSLNVGKNMNKFQIYSTASVLMNKFPYLKLEEMILAFREGTTGSYGSTFDRVDVETLGTWIDKFLSSEERAVYFERLEHQKQIEADQNIQAMYDVNPELVKSVVDSFKPERKVRKPDPSKNLETYLETLENNLKVMTGKEIFTLLDDAIKKSFTPVVNLIESYIKEKDI